MVGRPEYMGNKFKLLFAVLAVTLLVAAPAYAQNPTQDAYSITAAKVQEQVSSTGSGESSGSLPFTGLQLTVVLAAGIVLLGTGLVVRRMSRSQG
jgi:hypothetical protein